MFHVKHPAGGDTEDWQNAGFGLYVHWPYCQSKCPYCDFNSHVAAHVDQSAWISAFQAEIARLGEVTGPRPLRSIFFGGGTPSLMEARTVQAVIDAAQGAWRFRNDIEITLEANPTSVEAHRFADYAIAGVNRVSLGVQALNDGDLKRLGRLHSAAEALRAVGVAQTQFKRVSFDLIYARQDQTLDQWASELTQALAVGCSHMSVYQLTIEDGTAFGDLYKRGKLKGLPDSDLGADFYDLTQELCASKGFVRYETSNHALPGDECQHNLVYWRYGDYAGIGPGAHGRLTVNGQKYATEAIRMPTKWLARAGDATRQAETRTVLSPRDTALEYLLMGLRLAEGIDLRRLFAMDQGVLDMDAVCELEQDGLVQASSVNLRVMPAGQPLLDSILQRLVA